MVTTTASAAEAEADATMITAKTVLLAAGAPRVNLAVVVAVEGMTG